MMELLDSIFYFLFQSARTWSRAVSQAQASGCGYTWPKVAAKINMGKSST